VGIAYLKLEKKWEVGTVYSKLERSEMIRIVVSNG
jgi:hypothetical protein